jgi:hypothetical protein
MLSYAYIVYKSCELLGIKHALPWLPLFKDPRNCRRADTVWKMICEELGLEFIETP